MSRGVTLAEMLADLERRVAFHREQEGVHVEREMSHREERERHAAALAEVAHQLATLKAAAAGAEALLRQAAPLPAPPAEEGEAPHMVSRMVALVVQEWPQESSFGASSVTEEVERRFGETLREPVSVLTVGRSLLRLRRKGVLRTLRKGRPYAESLFRKNAA